MLCKRPHLCPLGVEKQGGSCGSMTVNPELSEPDSECVGDFSESTELLNCENLMRESSWKNLE